MRYKIVLAPEAIDDLRGLRAHLRSLVRDALERYLRYEPTKRSKSRIKRLRGMKRPQYRLRIDDIRVYYDVHGESVEVLAIVSKPEAKAWLNQMGESE